MKSAFVSYDHDDQARLNDLQSVSKNPNNNVEFLDRSLAEPVTNQYGHIIRRPPSDIQAYPVKKRIKRLLEQSSKLIVLIGRDTHSSEWVKWEIDTFRAIKGSDKNILLMRVLGDTPSGVPSNAKKVQLINWDLDLLSEWLHK